MSVAQSILAQGETALLGAGHGDELTVLSGADAGKKFTGRLDVEQSQSMSALLGDDPRMREIVRFVTPPVFVRGDIFTDGRARYRILKLIDNNVSSVTTDFEIQQIR